MKIKTADTTTDPVNIKELYMSFADKYSNVFIEDFGDSGTFIFRSLGRKEFREILDNEDVTDYAKEEVICELCTLYPKEYDFKNCDEAGLPSTLCKLILERSLLKDPQDLRNAIHYFRDKIMTSFDSQISCIIHEAFPEFEIEEIENWDVAKSAEYMTRSEYILHNLRGVPLTPVEESEDAPPTNQPNVQAAEQQSAEQEKLSKNSKLTPKRLAQLKKLYPDIDWEHDLASKFGADALKGQDFDCRNMSERPLDGSEDGQKAIPEALQKRFKVISTAKEE